jgi:hypothetical protein
MNMLTSTKKFQEDKDLQVKKCSRRLYKKLLQQPISLDAEILSELFPTLEKRVLYPAVELKQAIACSLTEYGFTSPSDSQEYRSGDIDVYTLRNVATWKRLEKESEGTITGIFCCLFLGVYQKSDNYVLVKPVVLVYDKEVDRQLQQLQERHHSKSKTSPDKTKKVSFQGLSSAPRPSPSRPSKDKKSSSSKLETGQKSTNVHKRR